MSKTHKHNKKQKSNSKIPLIIVITSLVVVVGIILLTKGGSTHDLPVASGQAEVELDQLLSEGKPTFVFYHSTDCYTCKVMMATVAEIYPEFQDSIALVDVNVYDASNQNLLQKAQIRSIPTQVFIDSTGKGTVIIGVMEPEVFRQHLATLAGGK
ncbi:MAG: thioredoxin fold domain-containing protein [Anaerolineaceae bacterium]